MKKRAIEKIMTIWWFVIWIIVIVGVVGNVYIFVNREIDYRRIDVKILNDKISSCLQNNYFNFSKDDEELKKDILEICNLNNNTFNSEIFSVKIKIENNDIMIREIVLGSKAMFVQCEIKKGLKAVHYPICLENEINIKYKNSLYKIKIYSASNAKGKRILVSEIK